MTKRNKTNDSIEHIITKLFQMTMNGDISSEITLNENILLSDIMSFSD